MPPKSEKAQRENAEVARFLEKLYAIGGFASWAEWGREAGGFTNEQMSDWKRGENAPSGHNFLRLIWAADRRRENALIQAAAATNPDGAEARIAAYHELVAALGLADGQEMAQPTPLALSATAAELMAEIRKHLVDEFEELDARLDRLEAAQVPKEQPPSQPAEVSR